MKQAITDGGWRSGPEDPDFRTTRCCSVWTTSAQPDWLTVLSSPLLSSRLVSVCRSCWRSWSCPGLMWSTPAGSRLIGCWRGGPASCRRSEPRYTCWHRWEVLHRHQGKTVSIRLQLNMVSLLWRADDSLCYCWSLKCKMLKIKWRCLVSLLSQADGPLKPSWTSDLFRPAGSGCWTEPTGPPEASRPTGSDLRTWERTEKSVQTNHSRETWLSDRRHKELWVQHVCCSAEVSRLAFINEF